MLDFHAYENSETSEKTAGTERIAGTEGTEKTEGTERTEFSVRVSLGAISQFLWTHKVRFRWNSLTVRSYTL